jgi:DNA processing protein
MNSDLLQQVALTMIPQIGPVQAQVLVRRFGDASAVFSASRSKLENTEGIGPFRASLIKSFSNFRAAEKEIEFIEKFKIVPLFLTDPSYPQRLLQCYDPPTLLYYRGQANLNASKMVAIVGTRNKTDYGRLITDKLVADLAGEDITIVSGLALGIDACAHKAAMHHQLPTVAVVAHGLDKVYPLEHHSLARQIIKQDGGLLTEFRSQTKPDRHHFPQRNRIVAGLCDAVVVIETDVKGGSMITADIANGYNRDVFALPGRLIDPKSAGCNHLIKQQKAIPLSTAQDLVETMGWQTKKTAPPAPQRALFVELSADEKRVAELLSEKEAVSVDHLLIQSGMSSGTLAGILLTLELQQVLTALPGKMYRLN